MIQVSIQKIEQQGLQTELDFERALLIERKLRIMAKTEPNYDQWRQHLRNCTEAYEDIHWSLSNEVDEKIVRSDKAESIIEQERIFIQLRKKKIMERLSFLSLKSKGYRAFIRS